MPHSIMIRASKSCNDRSIGPATLIEGRSLQVAQPAIIKCPFHNISGFLMDEVSLQRHSSVCKAAMLPRCCGIRSKAAAQACERSPLLAFDAMSQ
jgi:hypothetical protein